MFSRRPQASTTGLSKEIDGLPIFRTDEPFVLSNDAEVARLAASQAANFIRVCKFGLYNHSTSSKWFGSLQQIIDCAEEEYTTLKTDCNLRIPEHSWGLIPMSTTIKSKIRRGRAYRKEAFFDHKLLPKGYLLGCEVERITIISEFDRDIEQITSGFATPSEYDELRSAMMAHIDLQTATKPFAHADLSPEQCAIGFVAPETRQGTYLFDLEPVIIPSQFYPKR